MKKKPLLYAGSISALLVLTGSYFVNQKDITLQLDKANNKYTPASEHTPPAFITPSQVSRKKTFNDIHDQNLTCTQLTHISLSNWQNSTYQHLSSDLLEKCLSQLIADEPANVAAITQLILVWSEIDLLQALNFASHLPSPMTNYIMPSLIEHAMATNPSAMHDWLSGSDNFDSFEIREAYYRGLTKIDPEGALYDIITNGFGNEDNMEMKKRLLSAVLEEWSKIDAKKAFNWLVQQKNENNHLFDVTEDLEISLLFNLIEQNDQLAETTILTLPPSPKKTRLLQYFVKFMSELDPHMAMQWAQSISESNSRHIVMNSAIQYWAQGDTSSQEIIEFIQAEQDKALRNELMEEAAISLGDRNSAELASIFHRFSEEHKPIVVDKLTRTWINKDYTAASEWISTLSSGLARDIAVKNMVSLGLRNFNDAANAVVVAQTIEDSSLRYEASKDILLTVAHDNPQQAHILIGEMSKLSKEELDYLATLIPNH